MVLLLQQPSRRGLLSGPTKRCVVRNLAGVHCFMSQNDHGVVAKLQVKMYTAAWCRDCRAAKQFLDSHGIEYTEINVDCDPAASAEVLRHVGKRAIPQLVIDGEWFQPYKPGRGLLYDELYERFGIERNGHK